MGGSKLKWDKINKDNLIWRRGYEYVSCEAVHKHQSRMIPDSSAVPEKEQSRVMRRTNGAGVQKARRRIQPHTELDKVALSQQERRLKDIVRKIQGLPKKRPDLLRSKDLLWSLIDVIKKIVELDPARKDAPMRTDVIKAYEKLQSIVSRFN